MNLESILLSETSREEQDKYGMISLTSGIQKTKQNRNKLIDTENKLTAAKGEWGGELGKNEEGD